MKLFTTALVEGVKPLSELIPGKAMVNYVGNCIKRYIEPYLIRHEACQEAKTHVIEAKGYEFVFEKVTEKFEISIPVYFLTKEGRAIYEMLDIPMREDVMEMYKEIFSKICIGKADLKVVVK